MSKKIAAVVEEIQEWNDGDLDSLVNHGECPLDVDTIKARARTINKVLRLLKAKKAK